MKLQTYRIVSLEELSFSEAEQVRIKAIIDQEIRIGEYKFRSAYLAELGKGPYSPQDREQNL